MKEGMILAAGFGTRLRPLTDSLPKALAPINNKPLLDFVIRKFITAGIEKIVINTHYLSEKISEYLKTQNYNAEIILVHEEKILGTGGGIKNIRNLIKGDNFLVHNVDVISNLDLRKLIAYHQRYQPLTTMVMQNRQTYNQVLVDENNEICGLDYVKKGIRKLVKAPAGDPRVLAFCGIHVISSRIFEYFGNESFFSIIDTYLHAISQGEIVKAMLLAENVYWKDVGTLQHLEQAEKDLGLWHN